MVCCEFCLNVLMMLASSMGSEHVHSVSLMTPCNKNIVGFMSAIIEHFQLELFILCYECFCNAHTRAMELHLIHVVAAK